MKNFGLIVITALLSSLITVGLFKTILVNEKIVIREPHYLPQRTVHVQPEDIKTTGDVGVTRPTDFISAAKKTLPAVVFIESRSQEKVNYFRKQYRTSSGSGVIVSGDGYIVTNFHVIDNSSKLIVTLNNQKEYDAEVIGVDPTTDIALIKINDDDLPHMKFGNSNALHIGEWVIAVGNPFQLESTVTAGIVSAKARNISILDSDASVESFIQTDAVVNQGNSGGALVNTEGELVGINTAIITKTGGYEGYSFAIPSNLVKKVINDLRNYGLVKRALLGVNINKVTNDLAQKLDLPEVAGAYISGIQLNGAADQAGLRRGDVIISVNGQDIHSPPELQEKIATLQPGSTAKVQYWRNRRIGLTDVVLQQLGTPNYTLSKLGFELRDLSSQEVTQFGTYGARVYSIYSNSKVKESQMEIDFIITSVNGVMVESVEDVITKIADTSDDGVIELKGFYPKYEGEYTYAFYKDL